MSENSAQFEARKVDHIRIALDEKSQTPNLRDWDSIRVPHEAMPGLDLNEINLNSDVLDLNLKAPLFISSMTAGHEKGVELNLRLARAAEARGWLMGVGSQRRELQDPSARAEWTSLRKKVPKAKLAGNLGMSQIIGLSPDSIKSLIENLEACALFIHTNPLQEALQPEGTPHFKGDLEALEQLCKVLPIPVILKEVGCGFSRQTLKRLSSLGLYAVDVAGAGGTHWGRVEGQRIEAASLSWEVAQSFSNWGLSTLESLQNAACETLDYEIWASGGVRSGIDALKALFFGAKMVGIAKPLMEAAVLGEESLQKVMQRFEQELRIAMFCSGCKDLNSISKKSPWLDLRYLSRQRGV